MSGPSATSAAVKRASDTPAAGPLALVRDVLGPRRLARLRHPAVHLESLTGGIRRKQLSDPVSKQLLAREAH